MILNTEKILIIRLSSLGDVLLASPLIRNLKQKYPAAIIDFVVRAEFAEIVRFNPNLNRVFIYSRNDGENKALAENLAMQKYSLVLDLQNNLRSALLIKKIDAYKKKFNKKTFAKFLLVKFKTNNLINTPPIPVRYASILENFALDDVGLDLFIPDTIESSITEKKKIIGFCPGSKHFTKMWPAEYFILLGNMLIENGFTVCLFGGKEDVILCKHIQSQVKDSINLVTENNILQTAKDMQNCSVIVCNDSGLMHTACAIKVPVVAIFGSTVKEFGFFPYKNKSIVLENNLLSCRPCSHIGKSHCPKKHFRCMKEIKPLKVFESVLELIEDDR